jgi:integrase
MPRAAGYITRHHNHGWKYQFHIPARLRPLRPNKAGKPSAAFVRYIKPMTHADAMKQAREWAVVDQRKIDAWQEFTDQEIAEIASFGGLPKFEPGSAALVGGLLKYIKPATPEQERYKDAWLNVVLPAQKREEDLTPPTFETTFDRLFDEWAGQRKPKHTRREQGTIRKLKEHFGERKNAAELTGAEIAEFRDKLLEKKTSVYMVGSHLKVLGSLFKAAAQDPTSPFYGLPNPATGIGLRGLKHTKKERLSFSPTQVRAILETAARIRFGDTRDNKRHVETLWALRLMAYTGARPNEILQLQGGDVVAENGIRFLRIWDNDAETGKPHRLKSVKTDERRELPLHPDVANFLEYARDFAPDAFIFGCFKWLNPDKKRAKWIGENFAALLEAAGVVLSDPAGSSVLYSLRHSFQAAMEAAEVSVKHQKQLIGHRLDVHENYNRANLDALNKTVSRLKIVDRQPTPT